ncbi:MAG TPA: nicotinate phosphoribosyltransferase [Candidatus Altiarchaeales archaeon]|nr:nicotinate phosphoribosyltransferase [Candidatus Altiarchaeales archaeon]
MKENKIFYTATNREIKKGETTDVYFRRTKKILEKKNISRRVIAEVTTGGFPRNWRWAVLCGIGEIANLFENYPVDIDAIPEGKIFRARDVNGIRVPVMNIKGQYEKFCELETPLLGLICQSSGIATSAARIKKIAGKKQVISFGVRRMHPAISPVIDRSAYIGGFDGVSCILSAKKLGIKPMGTMPHALIIVMGDQTKAWLAFDEIIEKEVPRIALCDTFCDEKFEATMAAESIKNLSAVRLDTPGSRRGNLNDILREVRWELDIRNFRHVKLFVSGGIDEDSLKKLINAPVDGFGVGTSISNAPTIDFAMNIVEIDKKPVAKRGVFGGEKQAYRCPECYGCVVRLTYEEQPECKICGSETEPLLKPLMREGRLVAKLPSIQEIKKGVMNELKKVDIE